MPLSAIPKYVKKLVLLSQSGMEETEHDFSQYKQLKELTFCASSFSFLHILQLKDLEELEKFSMHDICMAYEYMFIPKKSKKRIVDNDDNDNDSKEEGKENEEEEEKVKENEEEEEEVKENEEEEEEEEEEGNEGEGKILEVSISNCPKLQSISIATECMNNTLVLDFMSLNSLVSITIENNSLQNICRFQIIGKKSF